MLLDNRDTEILLANKLPIPVNHFVIEVKNNNPIALHNIEIGNAKLNLQKPNLGLPPNVTVNCKHVSRDREISIDYDEYLNNSLKNPFDVQLIYVGFKMGRNIEPDLISANFKKRLITILDPYRQMHSIARHFLYKPFSIDGQEKIIMDIRSKEYCKLYLYKNKVKIVNNELEL